MNGYIFDIHINCCFVIDAQADVRFKYDLLEVGPLNMIRFDVVNTVRAAVRSISSSLVPLNWWTDFSFWQDFGRHGILRERASIARGRFVPYCGRMCGIPYI